MATDCRFWWIRCLPAACLFDCRGYDLFSACCHYKSKPFHLDSEALPEYQAFRSSQDYQFLPRNDRMNPTESTRTTTTTVSTFKFNFNSECNAFFQPFLSSLSYLLSDESDDRDYSYDDNERITGYWVTTRSPRYRSPHNPYSSHWGQGGPVT